MTARRIDVRPGARFAFSFSFSFGSGPDSPVVRMSFRWLPEVARWAWSMAGVDGSPVMPESHIQAGAIVPPPPGVPGVLAWIGVDGYRRADLGEALTLVWVAP